MKTYHVEITTETNPCGKMRIEAQADLTAKSARDALERFLKTYDTGDAPDYVVKVYEESETEVHGMTGTYSYDVCIVE